MRPKSLIPHISLFLCLIFPVVNSKARSNDIGAHLQAMLAASDDALSASKSAENASDVQSVKAQIDRVFSSVWGTSSGLSAGNIHGAENVRGWKTRWQTSYGAFDENFAKQYGNAPPSVGDIDQLGMEGRGRFVRKLIVKARDKQDASNPNHDILDGLVASLNNVIGWQRMNDGVTKAERQPRVDLTYQWDAPQSFWNSSADSGWLFEVYAQASNILKTEYDGDLALAKKHAHDLTLLIEKYRNGVDADGDGNISPAMMEGGLLTAMAQARQAGLL